MTDRPATPSLRDLDAQGLRSESAQPVAPKLVVWVLDDSPMEAAMARHALTPLYDVETFADGSTLLEKMASSPSPSVLVLDWHLPGMSGIELCRFLRGTKNEMELPILMLTVYGHRRDLVDGLHAGANDYLTKPYDAPELLARVGTLARIQSLHEATKRAAVERSELLARERDARAQAEAANMAKDDFLAMVSHELRTPLNAILGWTRMVRRGGLSKEQEARGLLTVERNAVAQTQLIEDLLDMSRILSRKLTIETEPVDVAEVVTAAADAMRPTATAKGIDIELEICAGGAHTMADPGRLQQVVGNLLTNAVKFTPKAGRVILSVTRKPGAIVITVIDRGQGIARELLPRIFERFQQADQGSKRGHGGLGLGLAIVQHIVELHGGSVAATSAGLGLGATFSVTLPSVDAAPRVQAPLVRPAQVREAPIAPRLEGLRVLVVDDDPDALELLAMMMRQAGAETTSASSATRALELLREVRPDVLISDIGMPVRDGNDLIRDVRELPESEGGRTPALALTAFAHADDKLRALGAGFDRHAAKPADPIELIGLVARLAGRFESTPSLV